MKYIIKFKKEGRIRFISHLDLQKVFLRIFRIIGIKPRYSNGFNPHPKLSFALPLSLGFASEAEYLELETESETGFDIDDVICKLEKYLPDGLSIVYIGKKPDFLNKKLASYIDCTQYSAVCPKIDEPEKALKKYLGQKHISYEKTSRKNGKTKEIDLKPSIHKMEIKSIDDNNIRLTMLLHAGNDSVLNPTVLIENLYKYLEIPLDINQLSITRMRVYLAVNGTLSDADHIIIN